MSRLPAVLLAAGLLAGGLAGRPAPATALAPSGSACPLSPADSVWHADVSRLRPVPLVVACAFFLGGLTQ